VKRFSLIGAGNLGSHLAHSLTAKGCRLSCIYKKTKYQGLAAPITDDLNKLVQESDFIVIATQESKIEEAARALAASSQPAGKVVFHTANALTSDCLVSLKKKAAFTASFSPLQTFAAFDPACGANVFEGVYFLTEGDPEAVAMAEEIAALLKANVMKVDKEKKVFFHIAAVAASNFLISILKLAERQLHKTAKPGEQPDIAILLPLIRQTLKNVEDNGIDASLTGPFKRKETGIIRKHLELLEQDEAALYKALTDFLAGGIL
jgi:predicted short-subunit dehydrogenase-like oxidoreductase (DUF2520 family)